MQVKRMSELVFTCGRYQFGRYQWIRTIGRTSGKVRSESARVDAVNYQRRALTCMVPVSNHGIEAFRESKQLTAHRWFCTSAELAGASQPENWPEHEFVKVAETCLEYLSETISEHGYNSKSGPSDFDIEFSQGVLTINLGEEGIYVLNTQTPNRQIWLSSPTSGPWRFAWSSARKEWISTRDGHTLTSRMTDELSIIFKEPVVISFENISLDD